MGNLILEKGPMGNKLVPISEEDFKKEMKAGTLNHLQAGIYEKIAVEEAESDQTYKTRDMEAETKTTKVVKKKAKKTKG